MRESVGRGSPLVHECIINIIGGFTLLYRRFVFTKANVIGAEH